MTQRTLTHQQQTRAGFTFLELMVVLTLLTGVIGVATPAMIQWMNARSIRNTAESVAGTLLQTSSDAMWTGLPHAFEYSPELNSYRSVTVNEKPQSSPTGQPLDENRNWKSLPDSLSLSRMNRQDNSPPYFKIIFDVNGHSDCLGLNIIGPGIHQGIHIDPVSGLPSLTTE
ncbi:MAG: prepilin-type N-terminal cleavage/methylation domain-containing protein [Fuerstiella sp.]|nr:prepilin-type N-terminal cleavage/methylation domain-containing protein [Fuerstiella sp.]